jgi:Integrase zinc binding domain
VYIPVRSIQAADALSRSHAASRPPTGDDVNPPKKCHSAIIAAMSSLRSADALTEVKSAYSTDPDFSSHCEHPKVPCVLRDGLLSIYHALCIPSGPLRDVILHDHHDAPVAVHRGVQKTNPLRKTLVLPPLRKDIIEYVLSCEKCKRAKASGQRKPGLIRLFLPILQKWEVVSVYFVFDLPLTPSGNNGLVVIVDTFLVRTILLHISQVLMPLI